VSYGETEYESVYAVVVQTNILFFVRKSCKVDGSLLLLNRANLEGSPLLGDSLFGLHRLLSLLQTIAGGELVRSFDGERWNTYFLTLVRKSRTMPFSGMRKTLELRSR
jgi:hypothetical protein